MNVKLKKNLVIFEDPYEWEEVRNRIKQDYGQTIFAISWRTRRELGFTIRNHKGLRKNSADMIDWQGGEVKSFAADLEHRYYYHPEVHLDFYNEAQMSWFVLKYLNNSPVDH